MARERNPNDKNSMEVVETFFNNHYNRNHRRYTYIEFANNKQEAIEFYKLKLLALKDMGASFMEQVLKLNHEQISFIIDNDPITAFILADGELRENINSSTIEIDVHMSNKEILELIQEKRKNIDYQQGIFKNSNEREFGSKLADSLYILDCRKFYLSYRFIQQKLLEYHGHNIKTDTLKKYYDEALEEYNKTTFN